MIVEIGTEIPIFLFWEYLFRNIGILSLQCSQLTPLSRVAAQARQSTCIHRLEPGGLVWLLR
jgi:hypothetical protein